MLFTDVVGSTRAGIEPRARRRRRVATRPLLRVAPGDRGDRWFRGEEPRRRQVVGADLIIEFRAEEAARVVLERLLPFAGLIPHSGLSTYHPVSHALGGLATVPGRYDDADRWFARAAELCTRQRWGCGRRAGGYAYVERRATEALLPVD